MTSEQDRRFEAPQAGREQAAVSFTPPEHAATALPSQPPQRPITAVLERHRARLSEIEGVHGVAEGRTPIGDDAIRVDIDDDSVRARLPSEIEGYPLELVIVPGGFGTLPAGSPYVG